MFFTTQDGFFIINVNKIIYVERMTYDGKERLVVKLEGGREVVLEGSDIHALDKRLS